MGLKNDKMPKLYKELIQCEGIKKFAVQLNEEKPKMTYSHTLNEIKKERFINIHTLVNSVIR